MPPSPFPWNYRRLRLRLRRTRRLSCSSSQFLNFLPLSTPPGGSLIAALRGWATRLIDAGVCRVARCVVMGGKGEGAGKLLPYQPGGENGAFPVAEGGSFAFKDYLLLASCSYRSGPLLVCSPYRTVLYCTPARWEDGDLPSWIMGGCDGRAVSREMKSSTDRHLELLDRTTDQISSSEATVARVP